MNSLHVFLALLLLLLIPAGALYVLDRKLLRSLSLSLARMGAQLLVLCLVVWLLYRFDVVWLNLLWLALMSAVSAWIVSRRAGLAVGQHLLPVGVGLFFGTLLPAAWLLAILPLDHAFAARWFVPLAALILGHSLAAAIRGLSAYQTALRVDGEQYEFLRGNGATHLRALQPFVRRALQAVLAPSVANLSAMGLFTMPLLLCGLLLGGIDAVTALVAMLLLASACLAASVLSLGIIIFLADIKRRRSQR